MFSPTIRPESYSRGGKNSGIVPEFFYKADMELFPQEILGWDAGRYEQIESQQQLG